MPIKFLVLGAGGYLFFFWGGEVPISFLWARGFFSDIRDCHSQLKFLELCERGNASRFAAVKKVSMVEISCEEC